MSIPKIRSSLMKTLAFAVLGSMTVGCDDEQGLLDQVLTAGQLVVSTDPAYPPQSFLDEDTGELDGFDVDVAEEFASRLGVDVEFATPDWEIVVGGRWQGRWDVSIGSMTPTENRWEVLLFSTPYYYTPASFAVHVDNTTIIEPTDLEGMIVGVGAESTYVYYLNDTLSLMEGMGGVIMYDSPVGIDVRDYTTDSDAIEAIAEGDGVQVDAIMSAQPTIQAAIDDGIALRFVGTPAFYEPLVFALDRSRGASENMLGQMNKIISEMHDDETLSTLSERWYGIDITKPAEPE